MTEKVSKKSKKETLKNFSEKASNLLFEIITDIPGSLYTPMPKPDERARLLTQRAAWKSATVSMTLSIPSGVVGMLTAIPDIAAIWKIQAQLVADIAASYGKIALLSREAMIWCLFRHSAAQFVRDIAVRTGSRIVIQKLSTAAVKTLLAKVGTKVSSNMLGKTLLRAIPAVGALGNGAYAFMDTNEVGRTAAAYFKALADQDTEPKAELVENSENND
jgi:hypothetical protein